MKPLDAPELHEATARLTQWHVADGKLIRDLHFPDFVQAIAFVNRIADLAEEQNHHPDIDIRYNQVRLGLVTHDAKGITHRDLKLAAHIDTVVQPKS